MTDSSLDGTLTDVPDLAVGHYTDLEAATGCTVVLFPNGAIAGVDVRGAAPGTRETDLLRPGSLVDRVHAILLTGGSAFGLAAADGVMRFLERQETGYRTASGVVPIVPAAVIYDLGLGRSDVRPDSEAGYHACERASREPVEMGSVGAGSGASVGKLLGMGFATKSGLGSASLRLTSGAVVGAIAVVNAGGSVIDPSSGTTVAGVRHPSESGFQDPLALVLAGRAGGARPLTNTTLALVATDAPLDKAMANRLASVSHDALARTLYPVHTTFDGDTVFAASTAAPGASVVEFNQLAVATCLVLERAIVRAALLATRLGGLPAAFELNSAR